MTKEKEQAAVLLAKKMLEVAREVCAMRPAIAQAYGRIWHGLQAGIAQLAEKRVAEVG